MVDYPPRFPISCNSTRVAKKTRHSKGLGKALRPELRKVNIPQRTFHNDNMEEPDSQDIAQETPAGNVFIPPSISEPQILSGDSYTYHSAIPEAIAADLQNTECVLGVDEAGRGPVLGPMVYGLLYLPRSEHISLLAKKHHFNDSKVLTPAVRSALLEKLCDRKVGSQFFGGFMPPTHKKSDLYRACGWATRVMSAQDISAGMLRPLGSYNLNAQAMDATIDLIKEVFAKGVNVKEIYIDTIGRPDVYQRKLERVFPSTSITVAKKADSLYPCVSAASVCAKVTRDAALEVSYKAYDAEGSSAEGWGSGYPSDARTVAWLKRNMDPLFGWGSECRFSWDTVKTMLDNKELALRVDWPDPDGGQNSKMTDFLVAADGKARKSKANELADWYGTPVAETVL